MRLGASNAPNATRGARPAWTLARLNDHLAAMKSAAGLTTNVETDREIDDVVVVAR
jgi:hypothetical protein